jgi:hypothetical protein
MKTNLMHCLSFTSSLNLYMFWAYVAHHQEVLTVYVQQLVRVTCLGSLSAGQVRMELPAPSSLGQLPVNLNM